MKFVCSQCGKIYEEDTLPWKCSCGGSLNCLFESTFTKEKLRPERLNMWRYEGAYPLEYKDVKVSFGEGLTPLVSIQSKACHIRVKMDSLMPTGSFKDRGTVMVINYLIKHGVQMITEDSSGNAGASVAGYCALGGIPCEIYVPKGNSEGKLTQIAAYGAKIFEVEGTRDEVAWAAQKKSKSYAGHNWHPMFIQGTKSLAYELWEQNGFKAPDNIVCVAGNGSTCLGVYYGFKELLKNKQVDKMPRIFVVQSENCNPIYKAYVGDKSTNNFKETIAEGIALAFPNKIGQIVNAAKETKGAVLCVNEEQIKNACLELGLLGIYAEPTSSTAYAGILKLKEEGVLHSEDDVITIISGNGLKTTETIGSLLKRG